MNNTTVFGHAIFAILSLTVLHPILGQPFILLLFPYVIYMVFSQKAGYLPALAVQVIVGGGTIAVVVFMSFILLSIINYNKFNKSIKTIFWLLISVLPILVYLSYQRYTLHEYTIQVILTYAGMEYFGFFAFFYGISIYKGVTRQILLILIWSIIIVMMLQTSGLIEFERITTLVPLVSFGVLSAFLIRKFENKYLLIISFVFTIYFVINYKEYTFTSLAMMLFTFILVRFYLNGNLKRIMAMTGIIVLFIILFLYCIGIYLYKDIEFSSDVRGIDITSYDNLITRLQLKFFGDRAPIWAGAYKQILANNAILPIHDLSNVIVENKNSVEYEFEAGAHTIFLELIRKYGYLTGLILIICYIRLLLISRRVFKIPNLDTVFIILMASAISTCIVVALTGTYAVMTVYSLLTFGIMGIGYGLQNNIER